MSTEMLKLQGLLPITFRGVQCGLYYRRNIPVCVWITKNYPQTPPIPYVQPTADMDVVTGHQHVGRDGMCYFPYCNQWNQTHSNVSGLLDVMVQAFSVHPPVTAKAPPPAYQPQQPQPPEGEPPEPEPEPEPEPLLALPPIPPSPVSGYTFRGTKFRGVYRKAKAPADLMKLGGKLTTVVRGYCEAHDIPYDDDEGEAYFDELRADMVGAGDSMAHAVQRMWTSFRQLRGREFCFILNEVVRNDTASCIAPAASLTRAINEFCVTPEGEEPRPPFPPHFVCVRGGGFDNRYRDFFAPGREFRQPAFLASSFLESTADAFMRRSSMPVKAKWRIRIDPVRKCRHVNLVTRRVPGLPDEQEYLFAPYSAFTVRTVKWAAGTDDDPHVIELDAAPDNVGPSEDLPLAPWS